jgi:tetratricopeptide (TPR) repeat protein
VHRDFKPDNVMIRRDGRVLVMDFGLARGELVSGDHAGLATLDLQSGAGTHTTSAPLTQTGALLGTPVYMAPEQFYGVATDAKTDQFSFCIALWEALFRERPFAGTNLAALSLAVTQGRLSEPERKDVPVWLRRLLERGLAVDPAQRFATMDELLRALQADPTRRRRTIAALAGTLAFVLGSGVGAHLAHEQTRAELLAGCEAQGEAIRADWNDAREAELAHAFAATERALADSAWQHTQPRMRAYADAWAELRTRVCREAELDEVRDASSYARASECLDERRASFAALVETWRSLAAEDVPRAPLAALELASLSSCSDDVWLARRVTLPSDEPTRLAALELRGELEQAKALGLVGKHDEALERARAVLSRAETLAWPPLVAEAHYELARLLSQLGKHDEARELAQRALDESIASAHDLLALDSASLLGIIVGHQLARTDEGLIWTELARSFVMRLDLVGSNQHAQVLTNRGLIFDAQGKFAEALAAHREALAIQTRLLGTEHPAVATTLSNVAGSLQFLGKTDEALVAHRESLRVREATLGPDHPWVAHSLNNIGSTHMARSEHALALAPLQRAHAILLAAFGPEHPDVFTTLTNIGTSRLELGDAALALVDLQQAHAAIERTFGPTSPHLAATFSNIGSAYHALGRRDEALASYAGAVDCLTTAFGPEHPSLAIPLTNIGNGLLEQGKAAEALASYQRALTIRERALGPDNPALGYALTGVGQAQLELGRLDAAAAALERALRLREAGQAPPRLRGGSRFHLARARWQQGRRDEARTLASAALDELRAAEVQGEELTQVETWLAEHG